MSWPTTRITHARLQLMLRHPYFASAVARLPIIDASKMSWCQTMATDGYFIYVNPTFCDELADTEITAVFAHELLHCVLGHIDRRGKRQRDLWNIAIDHATNLLLQDAGFVLPKDALADRHFHGMTSEAIYDHLINSLDSTKPTRGKKTSAKSSGNRLQAEGGHDLHVDPSDPEGTATRSVGYPTSIERRRIREELASDLASKLAGSEAGYLAEEVQRAKKAQVDWTQLLALFVTGLRRNDYRLFPFNKKHLWRHLYLPSIGAPGPDHLVLAVDTSGSMGVDELCQVLAELDQLRGQSECTLTVIHCDTEIHLVKSYEPWEISSNDFKKMTFLGRGGTDLRPPFDWVSHKRGNQVMAPDALIYLTDGFGPTPTSTPDYPVLWIMPQHGSRSLPFGKSIRWTKPNQHKRAA
jgi:predicted metal-dependent peptidase